jgi:hypothetical protein
MSAVVGNSNLLILPENMKDCLCDAWKVIHMGKQFANLHQPFHPDCFIYYLKKKRKFNALRRIQGQTFKSAIFFTYEDAIAWLRLFNDVSACNKP